jgi:hypothetical protein
MLEDGEPCRQNRKMYDVCLDHLEEFQPGGTNVPIQFESLDYHFILCLERAKYLLALIPQGCDLQKKRWFKQNMVDPGKERLGPGYIYAFQLPQRTPSHHPAHMFC